MFKIMKKVIDEHQNLYFVLVEEMEDDLALAQRIMDLRQGGEEYVAEKYEGGFSYILDI